MSRSLSSSCTRWNVLSELSDRVDLSYLETEELTMLTSSVSSSQWCKPLVLHLLCNVWFVTLSSNFLADWYLHVTLPTSLSVFSCNQFSTAGLIHNDRRFEMLPSCPSLLNKLVEKVEPSVLERQNAYFKRHMPTSDFSEGQETAFMGMRECL